MQDRHTLPLIFVVAVNHPASIHVCCKCNIYGVVYDVCRRNVIFMALFMMSVEGTWEDSYVGQPGIKKKGILFSSYVTDITNWFLVPPSISKRVPGVNRPEREVRAPVRFVLARWCALTVLTVTRFSNDQCLSSH